MRKEFAVLQKKTNVHEREIKRIQSLVTKYANYRGLFLGELKREKLRNKQQNDIIAVSKKVDTMKVSYSPEIPKHIENKSPIKTKDKHQSPSNIPSSHNLVRKCKLIVFAKKKIVNF